MLELWNDSVSFMMLQTMYLFMHFNPMGSIKLTQLQIFNYDNFVLT